MQHPLYITESTIDVSGADPHLVGLYGKKTVTVINSEPIGVFLRKPLAGSPDPEGEYPDLLRPFIYGKLMPGVHEFTCLNEVWIRGLPGHASTKVYSTSTISTAETPPWNEQ